MTDATCGNMLSGELASDWRRSFNFTDADRNEMSEGNDKLAKVLATKAKMHNAIVRAVEAKLATATLYGMVRDEEALRQCLVALGAEVV